VSPVRMAAISEVPVVVGFVAASVRVADKSKSAQKTSKGVFMVRSWG